jgi:hypothetical protein
LDEGSAQHKASIYTGQNNTEKHGHTSMPQAEFEPAIPVLKQLKTVHALDCAAIGTNWKYVNFSNTLYG